MARKAEFGRFGPHNDRILRQNRAKILDLSEEIDYVTREKWLQTKEKLSKVGRDDPEEECIKNSP